MILLLVFSVVDSGWSRVAIHHGNWSVMSEKVMEWDTC